MGCIRIAQAQINPTVGDFKGNIAKMHRFVTQAEALGADIITFPELAVCGYPPEDLLLRPGFLLDNLEALDRLAAVVGHSVVVAGFAHPAEGHLYNAAAVIQKGRVIGTYHKMELPNYGVFDEKRYFAPGSRPRFFRLQDKRFTVTICEDIWVADNTVEHAARRAEFVLNISASPFHAGKLHRRLEIARRFARKTGAVLFFNNLIGGQDELVFDGGAFVVTPEGRMTARAPRFEEALLVTDYQGGSGTLTAGELAEGDRDLELALDESVSRSRPALKPSSAEELGEMDEVYRALVLGTRDYVSKNGFQKVVLGLSGGIDSALTAAIAVEALGRDNVIGVTMPSRYTSSGTLTDAERLARNLGIRLLTLPLHDIYQAYLRTLAKTLGEAESGVAHENIQARIRGNLLMALSNHFGWLVLTTGNKSEVAVGYCTLYGDMAGGLAVIKDVPKTLVYALSEYVNRRAPKPVIPASILQRPPSAELRPGQKDEDTLPPYALLDPILQDYVEGDKSADEIARAGFDPRTVNEVIRMVDRNEYKRRQAAPGIKITPKAFGKDRRVPITNRYWGETGTTAPDRSS